MASEEALPAATTWKFAPVETMHVPPPDAPLSAAETWDTPIEAAQPVAHDPAPVSATKVAVPDFTPPPAVKRACGWRTRCYLMCYWLLTL